MILSVGLSHREAPVELRERLALDRAGVAELLRELVATGAAREAVCLSTCNRIEVYACARGDTDAELEAAEEAVRRVLERVASGNGSGDARALDQLRVRRRNDAILHLFRVASSLDSLVVGEPQILGQVKDAFELARAAGTLGRQLDRAMTRALHAAKRARSETSIGEGQVSVSSVAVDLARQIFGELRGHRAMLLGAGEMAESAAKLLVKAGVSLVVVNRSPERGQALALAMGAEFQPWDALASALVGADVIITSTGAREAVISRAMVGQAMRARRGRSLFFIDIAVPRDVDPSANDLDNVYVYDIDALSHTVAESMSERRSEAARAEALVRHEADSFGAWAEAHDTHRTIAAFCSSVRAKVAAEVERSLSGRLRHLPDADREALERLVDATTKKLVHAPLARIRALRADPHGEELAKALSELFNLGASDKAETEAPPAPASTREPAETLAAASSPDR